MNDKQTRFDDKLIIANASGFLGDRFSAAREMVQGGPIDFLTGDYLAELTMAILFKKVLKSPDGGYAGTFLRQMEEIMGECLDKKIRIVSNAGGLNPKSLAEKLQELADRLGLKPRIAYIEGDNLMGRIEDLQQQGESFQHLDKGISLKEAGAQAITANAYLGGWGITEALEQGADIVVGGRLADAVLVSGPAAWKFGWQKTDWDRIAGAVTAGHIIECGAQATGGNYSFIHEIPSFEKVGFPFAEIYKDGSFVISKHPGTGGRVSVGTVTAQLLYEVREPRYLTPDVSARFDTIRIEQEAPDRVRISDVKGEPPPKTTKVCINTMGGHKNSMTFVLTGLEIEEKARIVEETLFSDLGGKEQFDKVDVQLIRSDKEDPASNEEAHAHLKISVLDANPDKVGRPFSSAAVELALANIPGFTMTAPPGNASPTIFHWPTLVSNDFIHQTITLGEQQFTVEPTMAEPMAVVPEPPAMDIPPVPSDKMVKLPLGKAFAARSGDKGGNANLGVWGQSAEAFAFLKAFLTVEQLKTLLPDMQPYDIERHEFPNLLAVNFYIKGVLGEGVAASVRNDPQAKSLGEYLRAKLIDLPESIRVY